MDWCDFPNGPLVSERNDIRRRISSSRFAALRHRDLDLVLGLVLEVVLSG